ncbi:DUF397 domain-containing protein [Embleya sp. NBC_00896]|uniref:DUF397 domain-containing protein n=1 Tax=Embleya sp. NBC_00896 TaxID=2975961 RepID=UPI003870C037|nr:DUF397 domain-containing protein [Embleya sp. NBC_00896]
MSNTSPGSHIRFDSPSIAAISYGDVETAGHRTDIRHAWRRSSYSGATNNCVETAPAASTILVRDSKVAAGPVLELEAASWQTFIGGVGA